MDGYDVGDELKLKIHCFNNDGKGISFSPEGFTIIISGADESDDTITAEITEVFEEIIFADRKSRTSIKASERSDAAVNKPYDLDEDLDEDDDEDFEEDDDDE